MGIVAPDTRAQPATSAPRNVPWIEARAPEAFAGTRPSTDPNASAKYRIDAEILLPLGVGSIPLNTRRDVGTAAVLVREYRSAAGETVRAYEFVAFSDPDRAFGVDRLGFFWEAQATSPQANWTAYFGSVTLSRESTPDEAKQTSHRFEVIDGLTTDRESTATIYRVPSGPRRTNPADLYAHLRPLLQTTPPRRTQRVPNRTPRSTAGFLGAIDLSLRAVASSNARPPLREPFTYSAQPRWLELRSVDRDPDDGTFRANGWKGDPQTVHALSYRTLSDRDSELAEFRVWIDVPAAATSSVAALPLAFEYQPRAFVRLRFVRIG
jgi:hypothetical protein